jgi:hypothetical protein
MKVLAITSALLVAFSSAAAVASPAETYDDSLKARDAEAEAAPRWWGFKWSKHGHVGLKRDADAAPVAEAIPGWWGFKWSRHGQLWKKDALPEAVPGWWGFKWSRHGHNGLKRDVNPAAGAGEEDDADFIYLPKGMTPDDLTKMLQDAKTEESE